MKLRKNIAKGLSLGIIITNLPIYSFASNLKNNFYNEISNIKTKEDLQKSAQKAVKAGEVDTWIEGLANMPTSRSDLTSAVVDGKIYCIGGYNGSSRLNTVEVYNPTTDSWETKSSMPTNRSDLTSVVVDGKIYCIGGAGIDNYVINKVEVYDPITDSWETKTSMPTQRANLTSVVVDGKIYCVGGFGLTYNKVEVYDPATDSWETKTPMPTNRYTLTGNVVDGKIYCIGGYNDSSRLNTVEVYNPTTDSWETKSSMPTNRSDLTSVVVDGKIYCIGGTGIDNYVTNIVEVYDPATDSWETKTPMSTKRRNLTSAMVDGKTYCIGGYNGSSYLNTVEAYITKLDPEKEAENAVIQAETSMDVIDIETARDLVNKLPEGEKKEELQNRLDVIVPNISLERENVTSNVDIYIKSENSLHMALDTNSVSFEDYSGVDELEKQGAVNITINSSLPYQLNAYLIDEIYNSDKSEKIDMDRLNIKDNLNDTDTNYKEFTAINNKLILNDSCDAGNDIEHTIDLKLKGGEAYPADIYKTTIKFEVEQK